MRTRGAELMRLLGAVALAASTTACASSGVAPRPFPMPSAPAVVEHPAAPPERPPAPVPSAAPLAERIVRAALDLQGAPYRNGGSDPDGFDCSGFTQYVFAQVGLRLPRDTREQFDAGDPVDPDEVQPGDLIFYRTTSRHVSHVGIALGNGRFVHAPSARGVVRIESMALPYWTRRFAGIRRMAD
ncbi:MAG: C40 family peptidase [Acidobacteria bacterium]|nr:C40 family peptidase [Acidobacteriota bacterium]